MWNVLIRPVGSNDDWISLGKARAIKLTKKNGQTVTIGSVEDIFELDLTDEDKKMLVEMSEACRRTP